MLPMKKLSCVILGGALAAALALTACGANAGSGTGSSSMGMSESTGTAQSSQNGGNAAWRTGLGVLTEASASGDTSKVNTITAVVVLDGEGKVADVMLDEMELSLSADSSGGITLPSDLRTKRQKGSSYPLAEVSSLEKGWAEQADAFGAGSPAKRRTRCGTLRPTRTAGPRMPTCFPAAPSPWTATGMPSCAPARTRKRWGDEPARLCLENLPLPKGGGFFAASRAERGRVGLV